MFGISTFVSLQVVHNVGLCIALWDIQKLEDSYIFPGDGAHHTVGTIRLKLMRLHKYLNCLFMSINKRLKPVHVCSV